ncbi:MAG: class A beta-lactamase-related serine hydrolase [Acidobacteria bacterium]|nr:class A beta-lactamase-related serine hydrolase [Acidobacteriota bacterium]
MSQVPAGAPSISRRGTRRGRSGREWRALISSGTTWLHNENEVFHAASTMKVPVMMTLFRAMDDGRLSLDQPITVTNEFVSIYDGSTFSIPSDQDSDTDLYNYVGQQLPLEELIRRMIVRSSNLATNIVIQLVGADNVMSVMREIGAEDMKVLRGVEDIKAYRSGMNNTATAHDLMIVLRDIATRAAAPGQGPADTMIDILAHQEFNEGIPAGIPTGTKVAHKTGSITDIYHDAGIVYSAEGNPYILVVLTGGANDEDASRTVAEISRLFWEYRSKLR